MDNPPIPTSQNKPEEVYDSLAGNYESWIEESAGLRIIYRALHDAIDENREMLKGRVLDLGCGTGIFTQTISRMEGVREVVGLDISRESVVQAKGRCNGICRFAAGSATELPFPDSSFDAVIAFGDIISHIHNGYREAISEAGRVLRPGGFLLFDIDNKWNLGLLSEPHELKASFKTPLSGHLREWSFLDAFGNRCSLHFKTFIPSEITGLLNGAGLEVLDFRGLIILPNIIPQRFHYNYPPERPLGRAVMALSRIDRLIQRLPIFRGFGIGALVAVRKKLFTGPSKMVEIRDDETLDEIRGVRIIQKRKGYRFSADSLLLADLPDLTGVRDAVDLGTGSGIIAILLAMRSKELRVTGVELQETLLDLAVRNVGLSGLSERIRVVQGDIRHIKEMFRGGSFDLVVSNPPYYQKGRGRTGPSTEKTVARHEVAVTMREIADASRFLLREGGRVALVYPAGRRGEVIYAMRGLGMGPRRVREVYTKGAEVVLVEGEKGYSGEVLEEPPLSL